MPVGSVKEIFFESENIVQTTWQCQTIWIFISFCNNILKIFLKLLSDCECTLYYFLTIGPRFSFTYFMMPFTFCSQTTFFSFLNDPGPDGELSISSSLSMMVNYHLAKTRRDLIGLGHCKNLWKCQSVLQWAFKIHVDVISWRLQWVVLWYSLVSTKVACDKDDMKRWRGIYQYRKS